MKRKAYDITLRCILTGCDWHFRLFLRDPADALERAYSWLPMADRHRREFFRIVTCEMSANQARPVSL